MLETSEEVKNALTVVVFILIGLLNIIGIPRGFPLILRAVSGIFAGILTGYTLADEKYSSLGLLDKIIVLCLAFLFFYGVVSLVALLVYALVIGIGVISSAGSAI